VARWSHAINVGAMRIRPTKSGRGYTSGWPNPMAQARIKAPYYESRFIRANNPDRPQALWLRETMLLSTAGADSADVWLMVFDPDGAGNRALKAPHPVEDAEFRTDEWIVRIGEATLDDTAARGSLSGAHAASWDLRINGAGEAVKLLPDRQYSTRFPSAKTMVRSPLARFDGRVQTDGVALDINGWTGSVNHNWGRRHTPAYAFGQVCGFDEAPSSSLEIVTARAGVGPLVLPPTTLMVLRHGGGEYAARTVLAARRTNGAYHDFEWSFSARFDDVAVEGQINAEAADVIGLNYSDTNGKTKYCYNSALADCRVRLSGKEAAELTATRRAMFEVLTDSRRADVALLA
jgi:hypothetical protein